MMRPLTGNFFSAPIIRALMLTSLALAAITSARAEDISDSPTYRIVVNVPERVMRVYFSDQEVSTWSLWRTFPIAVGMSRYQTPILSTTILTRSRRPAWMAPRAAWAGEDAGKTIPFRSPRNPFRARSTSGAVDGYFLAIGQGVGFHSTPLRSSIGKAASHGCIRMKLEDVRELYEKVPDGTEVQLTYELYRVSSSDNFDTITAIPDIYNKLSPEDRAAQLGRALDTLRDQGVVLNQSHIEKLLTGISVAVSKSSNYNSSPSPRANPVDVIPAISNSLSQAIGGRQSE